MLTTPSPIKAEDAESIRADRDKLRALLVGVCDAMESSEGATADDGTPERGGARFCDVPGLGDWWKRESPRVALEKRRAIAERKRADAEAELERIAREEAACR